MKRIVTMILALTLLLGLAMPASAAKAKAAIIRLLMMDGNVTVRDAGGIIKDFGPSMRLYSGYTVTTGDRSSAYLSLDDTKAVKLDMNTSVEIAKSGRKLQIKLRSGQLVFNVTTPLASNEALEVRTSSMVVGVRGSSGVVSTEQVIFATGHGMVWTVEGGSMAEGIAIRGGERYRLGDRSISPVGPADFPSVFLTEVAENKQLQLELTNEGKLSVSELIAQIPIAQAAEKEAHDRAAASVVLPPDYGDDEDIVPAFGAETPAPEPSSYTVTWMLGNEVLKTETLKEGEIPVYSGKTPEKAADAQYSYVFTGWTPEIQAVSGDAAYTAVFDAVLNRYEVVFRNYDGSELQRSQYAYGETPAYSGAAPARPDTDKASYAFKGWDAPLVPVAGAAVYTAVYEATYDFLAIIPQGSDNLPYQLFFPTEGNTPITKAKAGEQFTFYLGGLKTADGLEIRLNGVLLGQENVYYSDDLNAVVCTFIVPEDPIIRIDPA